MDRIIKIKGVGVGKESYSLKVKILNLNIYSIFSTGTTFIKKKGLGNKYVH